MAMSYFNRLFSSQSAPRVKVEANSDEIVQTERTIANGAHEAEEILDQKKGRETPDHTDWEGFGDEKPVVPTMSAEKPKKKKKKKKKNRNKLKESDHIGDGLEVETSRLESSPKVYSSLDAGGQIATNGHVEQSSTNDEPMVENSSLPKRSRKANGSATKAKRAPKSETAVFPEEDAAKEDEDGRFTASLPGEGAPGGSVNSSKPLRSSEADLEPEFAEPETVNEMDVELTNQDIPTSKTPEPSQESNQTKRGRRSKISHEPVTKSTEINSDPPAAAQSLAPIIPETEPDTQEANLAASSQLLRDIRSVSHPEVVADDHLERTPRRPSEKALGKRKAVDEPLLRNSVKKPRRGKNKEPSGGDLRTFGFLPSDEASHSRRGCSTSDPFPTLLTDIAGKVWEENNRISQEPELPLHSQISFNSPRSSWNAVNNPAELENEADDSQSLFVPNQETTKSLEPEGSASNTSSWKHSTPVVEIWPMESTPSAKARPTPAKSASKTPKTPKNKVAGARAVPISKGKLSTNEFEALTAAVESFRVRYDLTEFQVNDRIHADAKDKFASQMWKEICDEVPELPRRTVMNTCRRKYYNFKRGPWDDDEDEELKNAHEEHPGKWKIIGEIMNRFPEDVRDRWRNYVVCGNTKRKAAWELDEEKRLRAAVKQCIKETREQSRFGIGGVLDDEESLIDWGKVSALMDRTRSRLQCRDKWMKIKDREDVTAEDPDVKMPISETWRMEAAAVEARLFDAEEKLPLLRAIRDSGAARESKIPWQTLKNELDGEGKRMAWKYCFRKLIELVPDKNMEFTDMVTYLIDTFERAAPNEPEGFDIPVEIFASSNTNDTRRKRRRQRALEDDGEIPSSSTKKTPRRRKQAHEEDSTDGDAVPVSSARKRTLRDRMQKEGDSQETTTGKGRSVSADIVADVTQGFESIKRTPKSAKKYVVRKSKRNQHLSEEKVIEDDSDEEKPTASGVDGDQMDLDHEEHNDATGEPAAEQEADDAMEHPELATAKSHQNNYDVEEAGNPEESEIEEDIDSRAARDLERTSDSPEESDIEEEFDFRAARNLEGTPGSPEEELDSRAARNGQGSPDSPDEMEAEEEFDFLAARNLEGTPESLEESEAEEELNLRAARNDQGSPDLDAPKSDASSDKEVKLGSPIRLNGFHDEESEAVSSEDEDMSDIPPVVQPRVAREASIEL